MGLTHDVQLGKLAFYQLNSPAPSITPRSASTRDVLQDRRRRRRDTRQRAESRQPIRQPEQRERVARNLEAIRRLKRRQKPCSWRFNPESAQALRRQNGPELQRRSRAREGPGEPIAAGIPKRARAVGDESQRRAPRRITGMADRPSPRGDATRSAPVRHRRYERAWPGRRQRGGHEHRCDDHAATEYPTEFPVARGPDRLVARSQSAGSCSRPTPDAPPHFETGAHSGDHSTNVRASVRRARLTSRLDQSRRSSAIQLGARLILRCARRDKTGLAVAHDVQLIARQTLTDEILRTAGAALREHEVVLSRAAGSANPSIVTLDPG